MSDRISQILPNLYISNWDAGNDNDLIKQLNLKAVLTICSFFKSNTVLQFYKDNGIDFMFIKLDDTDQDDIASHFDSTFNFIKYHISKGNNILVHCYAGISRSVTLVANYILREIYEDDISHPEHAVSNVLEYIRSKRPMIDPNPGFLKQLVMEARKYKKSERKNDLNQIIKSYNMTSCDRIMDSTGKPGNIICLSNDDFDDQGNLKNFGDVDGVILFWIATCGHCVAVKPKFGDFSQMIKNTGIRAFAVDAMKNKELIQRIKGDTWGYQTNGYPTIVGYSKGKFYSEYGYDPAQKDIFRSPKDFYDYSMGLGKASVEWA
jgi:protein-tyrosine phosphatase/thiol-disulfide isomerase/thioredoxin